MSAQRSHSASFRHALMYEDILGARKHWDDKIDRHASMSVTFSNSNTGCRISVEDYECQLAFDQGKWIEQEVQAQIASLRNIVGVFAVDPKTFQWTGASALAVRVTY